MFLTNPCLCANTIHKPRDKFCNLVSNSSIIFVIHVAFISTTVCNTAADFTVSWKQVTDTETVSLNLWKLCSHWDEKKHSTVEKDKQINALPTDTVCTLKLYVICLAISYVSNLTFTKIWICLWFPYSSPKTDCLWGSSPDTFGHSCPHLKNILYIKIIMASSVSIRYDTYPLPHHWLCFQCMYHLPTGHHHHPLESLTTKTIQSVTIIIYTVSNGYNIC